MKKILYIDMDNVLVDFPTGIAALSDELKEAYKGNYHLYADIDGKEQKYVIGKNKEAYSLIEKIGSANLTTEQLKTLLEPFILS